MSGLAATGTAPGGSGARIERIRRAVGHLRAAEQPVRVLASIAWDPSVKAEFFAGGAKELPKPQYPTIDPKPIREALEPVARLADSTDVVDVWLRSTANHIGTAAEMLAAIGTADFAKFGTRLYGAPTLALKHGAGTPLTLAERIERTCRETAPFDLGAPPAACHLADDVARRIRAAVRKAFGADAPVVEVVDNLSANALASIDSIRIRRNACFTDRDWLQLLHHEAHVHVGTALNGRLQTDLPILAASHAGTTRTQEGLAVLAEFQSGAMDPSRFQRLADRVLAIQSSLDGADFLEVFRWFRGRGVDDDQAFENTRRVFRGGVLEGGSPFTKDVVYLDGLVRVTDFLRTIVAEGRLDCLLLLFCGKLDLEDLPALAELARLGLCKPPRYLPPWVEDRRFLVTYLSYLRFLSDTDVRSVHEHYRSLLDGVEPVPQFAHR